MRRVGSLILLFLAAALSVPFLFFSVQNHPLVPIGILVLAILAAFLATQPDKAREKEAAQELDADAALVQKIAQAVRPSFWLAFLNNMSWFTAGVVASAYSVEVRAFLDRLISGQ